MKVGYATILKHNGEEHTVFEWAKIKGINPKTIVSRINKFGWSFANAIEKPIEKQLPKKRRFDANCVDCMYSMYIEWEGVFSACDYMCITGKRRPCDPGDDCTVKVKGNKKRVRPGGGKELLK